MARRKLLGRGVRRVPESRAANRLAGGQQVASPGFTLIELMVTIAIAAILVTLAAPSFREFLVRNRTAAISNELIASIGRARNEAVSRNICVSMCRSADGATCAATGNNWVDGWIVFTNANCDTSLTAPAAAADLLNASAPFPAGYSMVSSATNSTSIMFNGAGQARAGDAGRFDLQFGSTGTSRNSNRGICLSRLGRTQLIAFGGTCP